MSGWFMQFDMIANVFNHVEGQDEQVERMGSRWYQLAEVGCCCSAPLFKYPSAFVDGNTSHPASTRTPSYAKCSPVIQELCNSLIAHAMSTTRFVSARAGVDH